MFVQIFINDIVKTNFFSDNIKDGRHKLQLYSSETGLDEDIEFYIDINNDIKRLTGKSIEVIKNESDGSGDVVEYNKKIVFKEKNAGIKMALLVYSSDPGTTEFKKYIAKDDVKVGKNGDVEYNTDNGIERFFDLVYENGKAYVIPYINRIFLNEKNISKKTRIRFGGCVSYNKFKFIYFGHMIAVNDPEGQVSCSLEEFKYDELTAEVRTDAHVDYRVQEYFTRSPRIVHKLICEDIEIDPPTSMNKGKDKPLIYTVGPSLTMSLGMVLCIILMARANSSGRSMLPSAVMAGTMLAGAVLWPILSRKYTDKQRTEEEQIRNEKYRAYVDELDLRLNEKDEYNRNVYDELYPSIETLAKNTLQKNNMLWNHSSSEEGFLDVRIGKGTRESTINVMVQKERFTIEDDPLRKYASVIQQNHKYLADVPVSVNLNKMNVLGIVGSESMRVDMIKLILLRLSITHSYDEVKFAILHKEKERDIFEFAKWLPHCWSAGKKNRYLSDSRNSVNAVLSKIRDIYSERQEMEDEKKAKTIPHFVVFITSHELVRGNTFMLEFIENAKGCGVTFVLGYDNIGHLPGTCNNIIQLSGKTCTIYDKLDGTGKMLEFVPDISEGTDSVRVASILSSVKISEATEETSVPDRLSFMEMYRAKNIDDLIIERRWKESQPQKSLEAPIGVGANNEMFSLDIRSHGPHGLIAGTTGSGKSEFIQSYILSMAINYHPYDVGFVLIDYKGGGMANCFADLPHVMATITNLDGVQIKRSILSIESELKRREALFNEAGVKKLGEYQAKYKKGLVSKPLPRLILISDEFAELKMQEPEFMEKIIQIAHIGRSLGVNLILATQKPSGVVNDQIWANTNFRVCLKVADRADSREMLKRDEAAYITNPGRCYVQVGNNEVFKLIQSGYSGAPYFEDGSGDDSVSSEVEFIDLQGEEVYSLSNKKENDSREEEHETQLSAIVKRMKKLAESEGLERIRLWIDPLKNVIMLSPLEDRAGGFNGKEWVPCLDWLEPRIGMYDEPEKQRQDVLEANLGKYGHLLLYGAPGTGKTTFIQTLVYSMAKRYSPDCFHMYIMDFSSRSMGYFKLLPHVGDVVMHGDDEKIKQLFVLFKEELRRRKNRFSEYGVTNIISYMQASKEVLPACIMVIDGYAAFKEDYSDFEADIEYIAREGANSGIWLVITTTAIRDIRSKISESIELRFTLQLREVYDYISVLGKDKDRTNPVPESVAGRGLCKRGVTLEFQTALACDESNDAERARKLREEFALMAECWKGKKVKPIPIIPDDMLLSSVSKLPEYAECIEKGLAPLGYDRDNVSVIGLDFERMPLFRIMGEQGTGRKNLAASILELCGNSEKWLVDDEFGTVKKRVSIELTKYSSAEEADAFARDFINEIVRRNKAYLAYKENGGTDSEFVFAKREFKKIVMVIADFDKFFTDISNQTAVHMSEMYLAAGGRNVYIILVCDNISYSKFKTQRYTKNAFDVMDGAYMGRLDNVSVVFPSCVIPLDARRKDIYSRGTGCIVSGTEYRRIITPLVK